MLGISMDIYKPDPEMLRAYAQKDVEYTLALYKHLERMERKRLIKAWALFAAVVAGVIALRWLLG